MKLGTGLEQNRMNLQETNKQGTKEFSTNKKLAIMAIGTIALFVILCFYVHATQLGIRNILAEIGDGAFASVMSRYFRTFGNVFSGHYGERLKIFFVIAEIIFVMILLGIKKSLLFIYRYRWLVGLAILLFCTVNKYHGDSMGAYNLIIEPGIGTELVSPIMGEVRMIRSDEWAVSTPGRISASFGEHPYSKYNDILRGGNTLNHISGAYVGYTTLAKNFFFFFYALLGIEYGFSFMFCGQILLTLLVSLEFSLILSKHKPLPAVVGAFLIAYSSVYLWWGFPAVLWTMEASIVCFYYLLQNLKYWQKILLGIAFAISFSNFCTILYPAWQVPFGYVALVIAMCLLHEEWDKFKKLKWKDYIVVAGMLLLSGSLIAMYLLEIQEYVTAISNTVYPGNRASDGGFALYKLFYYFQAILYPYQDVGITSEYTAFAGFFPLPIIVAIYYWWKDKKNNWMMFGLSLLSIPYILFVSTGLPLAFCKLTLLSRSIPARVCDVIGYICILLIVLILAGNDNQANLQKDKKTIDVKHILISLVLSVICVGIAAFACHKEFPNYINNIEMVVLFALWGFLAFGFVQNQWKNIKVITMYGMVVVSVITGIYVRPVMKGFDAIWSKPCVPYIREITEENPEARWLAMGENFFYQGFLSACGAKCVNTTNAYPNMEFWHTLDPDGLEDEIYNRYHHLKVNLTSEATTMELEAPDSVLLHLNYNDLNKLGIEYLFTGYEINDSSGVTFENLYAGEQAYIYKIHY